MNRKNNNKLLLSPVDTMDIYMKKWLAVVLWLFVPYAQADNALGQFIQINTRFHSIVGHPTWLLIIRDVQNGQILPYLFDIRSKNNFWIALTFGHSYRVTVSQLQFNSEQQIDNFCALQDGVLNGISMTVNVSGDLTTDPTSYRCHVLKYRDMASTLIT